MDPDSYLRDFKNNFFIGNYSKNIETWRDVLDESQFGEHIMKIDFYIARSLIAQTKLAYKIQLNEKKNKLTEQFQGITKLTNNFIGGILVNNVDVQKLKESFYSFKDDRVQSLVHYLIWLYMGIQSGQLEEVMKSEKETDQANFPFKEESEIIYLQFLAFLQANNLNKAQQKLNKLRAIDDEDVLTLLAQVYYNMNSDNENVAIQYLGELKERFGDSPFLINLKISILMRQQKFAPAFALGQQLFTILTTKENLKNSSELEILVTNMISLGEILNKPIDEYLQSLQQINYDCINVERAQKLSQNFDDFCSKMSTKA
ncbi:hypothetical protein PPERSA_11967 [Pseudocohnilembus persalinus]|uniref:Coatomer subunit epsilon n=1 Tax=Pseudocohnilembus persalinus TaxID=266149 RepID=A0A0V0QK35_PSEPJ|nr:hypothetical protein PPERSA_11967 [Pseudocohnilembus persalinus]|eukprot:KRX02627.1 hypothetical protein PPERSA_11967 [Pseudocohnilembus persalinus]